jgi:hypothetical protein
VPFAGWPYASILKRINGATRPEHLGKAVIDSYVNHFAASSAGDRVAMTLLNIGAVKDLKALVSELALRISAAIASNTSFDSNRLAHVRTAFLATAAGDVRPLIDLYDLCEELQSLCADLAVLEDGDRAHVAALRAAAAELLKFVEPKEEVAKMFAAASPDSSEPSSRLVVFHKRHPDLDGLHGLGIFAPFVTDDEALKRLGLVPSAGGNPGAGRELYRNLNLVRDTQWPQLVFDDLRQELSPEIVEGVEIAGTTSRADRSAIAQMLISVDSAFNKFDRTLATTKARADRGLREARPEYAESTHVTPAGLLARFRLLRLFQAGYADALARNNPAPEVTSVNSPGEVMLGRGATSQTTLSAGNRHAGAPIADEVVEALRTLEKAVGEIERTTKRALTHASFGLGPSTGKPGLGDPFLKSGLGDPFLKSGLGDPFLKSGLGDPFLKSGLGDPFLKSGLGDPFLKSGLGAVLASLSDAGQGSARSVVVLFALVGEALADLERAVARVEATAAMVLAEQFEVPEVDFKQQLEVCRERIASAFRILDAASNTARRTLRRVLADPVYGLGPGLRGVGLEERQELADVGGLSSRNLVLL